MAKRSHSRSMALARPIIMSAPRPAPIVIRAPSAPKKGRGHGRRLARRIGGAAHEERHRIGAVVGGFVLGMMDKSGTAIPTLPYLGKAGTLGLVAWGLGKYSKSAWASHAATGLLSIAAYELAKDGSISGLDYVAGSAGI